MDKKLSFNQPKPLMLIMNQVLVEYRNYIVT